MLQVTDVKNFRTLCTAFVYGDVALVEVLRVHDKVVVPAICTVEMVGGEYQLTPFATLVEGNPFELFRPPLPGGGFDQEDGDDL